MYCLDSLPMLAALVLLNLVHPGVVMPGKECDMPGRKERKRRARMEKETALTSEEPSTMSV